MLDEASDESIRPVRSETTWTGNSSAKVQINRRTKRRFVSNEDCTRNGHEADLGRRGGFYCEEGAVSIDTGWTDEVMRVYGGLDSRARDCGLGFV